MGQLGVGAASAQGQGLIGQAQAYGGAINQLGNSATLWSLLSQKPNIASTGNQTQAQQIVNAQSST